MTEQELQQIETDLDNDINPTPRQVRAMLTQIGLQSSALKGYAAAARNVHSRGQEIIERLNVGRRPPSDWLFDLVACNGIQAQRIQELERQLERMVNERRGSSLRSEPVADEAMKVTQPDAQRPVFAAIAPQEGTIEAVGTTTTQEAL